MSRWLAPVLGLVFLGACFSIGARWAPWVMEAQAADIAAWGADARMSPDGRRVAVLDWGSGTVYDTAGVDPERPLEDSKNCHGGRFSPDGRRLFAADENANVRVWDVESGKLLQTLPAGKEPESSVVASPDGELVAVVDGEGPIRILRTRDGVELITLGARGEVGEYVGFSPDGTRVVSARGSFRMWDLRSGTELFNAPSLDPWHLAFSSDGARLLTDHPGGAVSVLDAWTGRVIAQHKVPLRVTQMAYIPGGSMAILVSNSCKADGSVRVLDTRSGRFPVTTRHTSMLSCVAVSGDGRRVLFCGYDKAGRGSTLWRRRRPEPWWGIAWLPELWAALASAGGLIGIAAQYFRRRPIH